MILARVPLEAAGYPQPGDGELHIAHAPWGGLLLSVAVLPPLAFGNRWALWGSVLLGGMGIGLLIDEMSMFITRPTTAFFAPALSVDYGFFLLTFTE